MFDAKETYMFEEPTNHSHPIPAVSAHSRARAHNKFVLPGSWSFFVLHCVVKRTESRARKHRSLI